MKKKKKFFVLSVVKTKMSVKRKLNTKTLKEKCDILTHIEKDLSNKEAADKFDMPKNTISTWIKNKEKIFKHLKKVLQALRSHVVVNKALFERFVLQRSQNIPIDRSVIQGKGLFFAEKLENSDFKALYGWLDKWKKR